MIVYVGGAGSRRVVRKLREEKLGRMVTCVSYKNPVPGLRWALDNGAYSDWRKGQSFDGNRFVRCLDKIPDEAKLRPDFVVAPDIVAGGKRSLKLSHAWLHALPERFAYYLAVQDRMTMSDVLAVRDHIQGVFVGGTLEWKLKTAADWVEECRHYGLPVHIGRVGTMPRLAWARRIGAASVDSSTFVQAGANGRHDKLHRIESSRKQSRLF